MTKQQIIDIVNAGYEVEVTKDGVTDTITRILGENEALGFNYFDGDTFYLDVITSEGYSHKIKPRPFTSLSLGTRIEDKFGRTGFVKKHSKYQPGMFDFRIDDEHLKDSENSEVSVFHSQVIPIIDEHN